MMATVTLRAVVEAKEEAVRLEIRIVRNSCLHICALNVTSLYC